MKLTLDEGSKQRVTIIRFRDGDTVECHVRCDRCDSIRAEIIRLVGIESWEHKSPQRAKAIITADTLNKHLAGSQWSLARCTGRRDKYGRLIADLLREGALLSNLIVDMGYAWFGVGNHSDDERSLPVSTTI